MLVLAGSVAVVAGAVGADRATAWRLAAESTASAPGPVVAPSDAPADAPATATPSPVGESAPAPAVADEARVPDAASATSLALLPGWRVVPSQDVVEVPPGRFVDGTILQRGAGTVVLVGVADPDRVPPRANPAAPDPAQEEALDAEARRLADAYAELLAPGDDTASVTDNAEAISDLPTRTSVRRVEGGGLDGALVRVSTLAAPGRTLAVLAVARPAPDLDAEGDAADALVRSLRLEPASP
ncbi:MAG TPA: hypothetical protein VK935_20255 [Actinomycetospora sp.]|nr:hypothetical protein [Actinomycetospora sp.]